MSVDIMKSFIKMSQVLSRFISGVTSYTEGTFITMRLLLTVHFVKYKKNLPVHNNYIRIFQTPRINREIRA